MKELILAIILAALGSSGLFTLIQFLFNRYDKKKGIEAKLLEIERDGKRTQLLMLMADHPEREDEIMKIAQKYFCGLNGNWYVNNLFNDWLKSRNIRKPLWYKE